jgi:hypothetical protein
MATRALLRVIVIIVVALTVIGGAIVATVVRTYTLQTEVRGSSVIWNEQQLVVFVRTQDVGTSTTVMQQLTPPAARWPRWLRAPSSSAQHRASDVTTTIVRFDDGKEPGEVEHLVLIPGGYWNGREIKRPEGPEYLRLLAAAPPDEAHRWHLSGFLAAGTFDLLVRLHGETVTLRGTKTAAQASIDLVRKGHVPDRVFELNLAPRAVSKGEYERAGPASPGPVTIVDRVAPLTWPK